MAKISLMGGNMTPSRRKTTGKRGGQLPVAKSGKRRQITSSMQTTRVFAVILALSFLPTLSHAGFFDEIKNDLTGPAVEGSPKYTALYFSAHWCPPCRMFTPKLVEWYKEFKAKHPDFELVFVSGDRDQAAMEEYIKEAGMPWPVVKFDRAQAETFGKFSSSGIPYLVLIDNEGNAVTAQPGNEWQPPTEVLGKIEQLVP
jgi:thiol-disulfide isomerase/thioredoxin